MVNAKGLHAGWRGHLLAIFSGALVTLSLAPYHLWPLGILSAAALVWLWSDLTPRQAALRGWFYGAGMLGTGTSWVYVSIHTFGAASIPLAVLLTSFFCGGLALLVALQGYLYARFLRPNRFGNTLGFTASYVLADWTRSWILTGFPWLFLGYGHLNTPLAGWAPLLGVFGLTFLVVLTGSLAFHAILQKSLRPAVAAVIVWIAGAGLQQIQWTKPSSQRAISVAMVQANIPQDVKWDRDQYQRTLKLYSQLSQPLWSQADIVVWPEAAIPGLYQVSETFVEHIASIAKKHHSTFITGIPYEDDSGQYFNSIMAFGEGQGLYFKQRLVPFGEYVPLAQWLRGLIAFFDLPMSSFSAGPANQPLLRAGEITLAPFICYEVVYPDMLREWLPDADALITISNDAWFGDSIGPLQHLQMAQMRALESGRYLIRATGNGVTAIVDPRGQVLVRSEQFVQQNLTGTIYPMRGITPFAATGSWPVIIFCMAIIAAAGIRHWRRISR